MKIDTSDQTLIDNIPNLTIRMNAKCVAECLGEGRIKDLGIYENTEHGSLHLYQINAMRVIDHQGNDIWEVNNPTAFADILKTYGFVPKPNPALEFCNNITHGYINTLASEYKPGLRFTETGLARAACICGWLTGIYQAGNLELANGLAVEFISQLEYLAKYGGTIDKEERRYDGEKYLTKVPRYTVELSDDGTSHGFGVLWYGALVTGEQIDAVKAAGKPIKTFDRWPDTAHVFSHNGGLLYHGPGGGENFSVTLSTRHAWSIHT